MQEMMRESHATAACSQASDTGPAPEATTPAVNYGFDPGARDEATALLQVRVSHNQVKVTAVLRMGGQRVAERVFTRRKGGVRGWVLQGRDTFTVERERITTELAEFADSIPFPFELANMLPGKKASPESIAKAAAEVAHG